MGIGFWVLGIGYWVLGPIPNPHILNKMMIRNYILFILELKLFYIILFNKKFI